MKYTPLKINVGDLQPQSFTESQPGAVEDQKQDADDRASVVATEPFGLLDQGTDLVQRQDMGHKVGLRRLR